MTYSDAAASLEAAGAAWEAMASPLFRLPTYIAPQHYAIEFQPNTKFSTFVGAVYITLKVVEAPLAPLTHLILHALDLTLYTELVRVFVPHKPQTVLAGPNVHPSQRRTAASSYTAMYNDDTGRMIPCVGQRRSAASETVQLMFNQPLATAVGDVFVLFIEHFDGCIDSSTNMVGLYHSSSTDREMISTHLEPTHARRLFPCFDEPAIQATFQLSVITGASFTVISNTEMESDVPTPVLPYRGKTNRSKCHSSHSNGSDLPHQVKGEKQNGEVQQTATTSPTATARSQDQAWPSATAPYSTAVCPSSSRSEATITTVTTAAAVETAPFHCVRFQPTPPIHTCVIGFHVGRFTILEQRTRLSRVLCRVVLPHTEPNSSGWFALDLATKALDFFEDFFNVQLPLKKLDVVAMERFAVLGMENWGLINLHRDYLIVTGTTPLERRQRITRLIGHETCHQWFGNWISIEWWNCLWLKEGMCRYLEYFFVNAIFPSWGLWNEFLSVIMNDALLADADPCETHPVDSCNSAPRRIHDSFDTISYGKGACVLRMMFSFIGTEWLKRATHLLMIRFRNRSFNAKDLGDCIVQTADERCSKDAQAQHAKAISYALQMVDAVSHPYLYIQQLPGKGYNITQYITPNKQHGLLVEYLKRQRSKAGAPVIDLFSSPAQLSFLWKPEETLTRVSRPFAIPLRSAQWHRGGHGSVHLIFIKDTENFVPLFSTAASLSSFSTSHNGGVSTGAVTATVTPHPCSPANSHTTTVGKSGDAEMPTSPISLRDQVCYFNHGGGGFYQCDYDMATWRQLFEFVAAFSDEDRMVITLHFINTAKAQLGHQPDTFGDRCTLFFEWLLKLTRTPGAMNSYLWDIVTRALTHLVLLVQQYYCQSTVKAFVNDLYAPLQKRCALSFFAQEKTVSFQSSIHLSRHLVLSILQLLCLCENPEVVDEAKETAQWALARVAPALLQSDSPYQVGPNTAGCGGGGSGEGNATTVSGCTTATTASLAVDSSNSNRNACASQSSGNRLAAPSLLATASLGALARRSSQAELGSSGNLTTTGGGFGVGGGVGVATTSTADALHSSPAGTAIKTKLSPAKVVTAKGYLLTSSFPSSASRAPSAPQLTCAQHNTNGNNNNNDHPSGSNFFSSFGVPPNTTDWAAVKNSSIASYPYQRAEELNLADASHIRAGEIALAHLASQGCIEHWVAAAAVAAEALEIGCEELQKLCVGTTVPCIRLTGLDHCDRDDYLRLVVPAVFSLDREQLFPFMATVFQSLPSVSVAAVEALYRNSHFLLYLASSGFLSNRRVLNYVLTCGAEICSNGFVIAQLKALAQGSGSSGNNDLSSVNSSVDMFKGVEFADTTGGADNATETTTTKNSTHFTDPPSKPVSTCTDSSTGVAYSTVRRTLRVQSPAVAGALDMMESNCVWMDYCCWHYNHFLREQRQQQVWRPTRSEENSSMQMSAPAVDETDDDSDSPGGVSI